MTTTDSRKANRRFTALDVGEVSLVDTPANELEFNVVKRKSKDGTMADAVKTEKNDDAKDGAELVPVEVSKAATEAVEKAMEQVSSLVETIHATAKTAQAEVAKSDDDSDEEIEKAMEPEVRKKRGGMRKAFKEAGLEGDALKNAMAAVDKTFGFGKKPVEKAIEPAAAEQLDQAAIIAKATAGTIASLTAASALTPTNLATLQKAVEQLNEIVKQLTMQSIPHGSSPSTTVPSNTKFGASGVAVLTKSLGELNEKVGELVGVHKSLEGRMADIEKTRSPSSSISDDGGTDTKEVKTEKSLWSGIL